MQGWINGGYFVVNRSFLRRIEQDSTVLEQSPLETAAIDGELNAHFHYGFWQCMDNIRDKGFLENLYLTGQCKWNAI
jgi:glucose-1-phosphate cytidylyltransferase